MQTIRRPERRPPTKVPTERTVHDAELIDEMDDLLDAIDEALEKDALEITRTYRQKGGQ